MNLKIKVWPCAYCVTDAFWEKDINEKSLIPAVPQYYSEFEFNQHLKIKHPIIYKYFQGRR